MTHETSDFSAVRDALVIGGGPAGSTAAAYLAMLGHRVTLLEQERFPRYRVGESLLPSMMPVLQDFGLLEEIEALGFPRKTGGSFVWGRTREMWDVLFTNNPFLPFPYAYHVERSVFDRMLLDHARRRGVEVLEDARVTEPVLDGDRVVGVRYEDAAGATHALHGRFVVDASGPAAVLGRRLTKRSYDDRMRQVAFYSYYRGVKGATVKHREGHVIIVSCPKGWFWYIPMGGASVGEASVGLVSGQEFAEEYKVKGPERFFEEAMQDAPELLEMLGSDATRGQQVRSITDWAYACERMAGPGWYLAGDAACFLDPLLSTGASMAMLAGYSASACIHTALGDPSLEEEARAFYDGNYRRMWSVTRDFLHYFYAGNVSASRDDLFWKARGILNFQENVGASQAFCFFVNTIPANPHAAVRKQIHMYQQFMANLDHPIDEMAAAPRFQEKVERARAFVALADVTDDTVLRPNGVLETSWMIDGADHVLVPVRGIAYDQERPVLSSTGSWLLGRNVQPIDDAWFELLTELGDGLPLGELVRRRAAAAATDTTTARAEVLSLVERLDDERLVLFERVA